MNRIEEYCNQVQESLVEHFWSDAEGTFVNHFPVRPNENWIYWWHAHTLDCLIDAYHRTSDQKYLDRLEKEYNGTYSRNGNTFLHNWYDDMEWMALAQLRLWDATKKDIYKDQVLIIWNDIKTAWNDNMGGGLAWKKDQLDYKNTPANAPAAILAFRLYQRFRNEEDLLWGKKILDWNLANLTDPVTGFVWDGINRLGDGNIDYDWNYTYNQGVVIGALVEEYRIEQSEECLAKAIQIANITKEVIIDSNHGMIPYEGEDDCGLFKGILIRYLYDLIEIHPELPELREMILHNARCVVEKGINEHGLIGGNWEVKGSAEIDLAQHLSGIMLLEIAAKLLNNSSLSAGDINNEKE